MKRIIALLLVLAFSLGLTACSQVSANDLMKGVPAKAVDVLPDMDAGAAAAADFGVRLFKTSIEEGENTLISPLSVLYALAMTANGADGETLAQMEQVLGMDVDNLNSYMLDWLKRIEKVLLEESVLDEQIFEVGAFKNAGGFTIIDRRFGGKLREIITELNDYLYEDGGIVA